MLLIHALDVRVWTGVSVIVSGAAFPAVSGLCGARRRRSDRGPARRVTAAWCLSPGFRRATAKP
jgi:hypothetical protein